mmetsp:Transcript_21888/g.30672  ORF Transcript_21888/g.30672 Transcript_21888/m.30672 type:complete len:134 (+) Transcript_21888:26-427(+)
MPSRRSFAEIGRIVCINYGKDNGKIGVIVDMCDSMTCLIDGPSVERKLINFRRLAFTDIKLPIKKRMRSSLLYKAWTEAGVDQQFAKTTWGQKIANQNKRKELTDFDRFVVKTLKAKKNKIIAKKVKELKAKK